LSNPYSLEKSGTGYFFTTDAGLIYYAYFEPYQDLFIDYPLIQFYIHTFNFEVKNFNGFRKPPKDTDGRIKDTIAFLIDSFFKQDEESALIIICDSADRKHKSRNKMFNDLFLNNDVNNLLEKHDGFNVGKDEEGKVFIEVYSSLIINQNHIFREELIEAYHYVRTEQFIKTEQ